MPLNRFSEKLDRVRFIDKDLPDFCEIEPIQETVMRDSLPLSSQTISIPQRVLRFANMPPIYIKHPPSALEVKYRIQNVYTQWCHLLQKYIDGDHQKQLEMLRTDSVSQEKIGRYKDSLGKMDALVEAFRHYLRNEELSNQLKEAMSGSFRDSRPVFSYAPPDPHCISEASILVKDPLQVIEVWLIQLTLNLQALRYVSKDKRPSFWALLTVFSVRSFITIAGACASLCLGLGVVDSIHIFVSTLAIFSFSLNIFRMHEEVLDLRSKYERERWASVEDIVSEMEALLAVLKELNAHIQHYERACIQVSSSGNAARARATQARPFYNRAVINELDGHLDEVCRPCVSSDRNRASVTVLKVPVPSYTASNKLGKSFHGILRPFMPNNRTAPSRVELEEEIEMTETAFGVVLERG